MPVHVGTSEASGALGLRVIRAGSTVAIDPFGYDAPSDPSNRQIALHGMPQRGLPDVVNEWRTRNFRTLARGWRKLAVARLSQRYHGMPFMYGALYLRVFRAGGDIEDLGLASLRVVTTAGVTYICADIAGGASDSNLFKYHGVGTGTTAEASGDTALVTESTTALNPDSTRATGSQSASTNTYTTVGTNTFDASAAITEHGIFTQAATGGGTLLDRSVFSAINVVSGDSIQSTYVLTLPAGS